jgi:NAD(P)H dehydrogenase (quinone)
MTRLAIVYHSGYGHTAKVAQHVHLGAQTVEGVTVKTLTTEEAIANLDALDGADAIVFGSPTYMGSVSAPFKAFMDASSKKWFTQAWTNKLAAGFTNSGGMSGDKLNTLLQMAVFAGQHNMLWVPQGLVYTTPSAREEGKTLDRIGSHFGLMTQADNAPADVTPPAIDLETAEHFGKKIATLALRWSQSS